MAHNTVRAAIAIAASYLMRRLHRHRSSTIGRGMPKTRAPPEPTEPIDPNEIPSLVAEREIAKVEQNTSRLLKKNVGPDPIQNSLFKNADFF